MDTDKKPIDNKQLFHKLLRLHRWDEQRRETLAAADAADGGADADGALRAVESLAADREGFARVMREAEEWLKSPGEKKYEAAPETREELKKLYALLASSRRLREIFAAALPFSEADPRAVETLARFADVTPDGQSMLNTQDAVFMGVLEAAQSPDLSTFGDPAAVNQAAALLTFAEHLGKALAVLKTDEGTARLLAERLPLRHWPQVLASLEDGRDYTDGPDSEAGALLHELQPDVPPELQAGFGRPPRLSQIDPGLFRLVWEQRGALARAAELLPAASLGGAQGPSFRPAGLAIRDLLHDDEGVRGLAYPFEYDLRLRFEIARHLVEVRKTAKVETLIYKWPRAARLALANRTSIVNVESYLLQQTVVQAAPNFTTDEERELYKLTQADDLFERLLRTKPYFSEIALFQYLSAAPLPPVTRPAATPTATATEKAATPSEQTDAQRGLPAEQGGRGAATPSAQTPPGDYDTYFLTVEPSFRQPDDPEVSEWQTAVYHDGGIIGPPGSPQLNTQRLYREVLESAVGEYSQGGDPLPLISRMFSRTDREYLFRVVTAGRTLFKTLFGSYADVFRAERQKAGSETHLRVAVACDPDFKDLPWEWLALPDADANFVLSERHSLVRYLPSPSEERPEPEFVKRLSPPLRVLIVIPTFDETSRVEAENRARQLEAEMGERGVSVKWLAGSVTQQAFRDAINDTLPHVLHYEGAVATPAFAPNEPGFLMSDLMLLGQLKKVLKAGGLQLLLLRNSANATYDTEALHLLLEGLVGDAIPAALAPVREMDGGPGFEFVRSFYRALGDGKRLEEAVARARLELLSKGGDWSAYALFAHLPTLQSSHLLPLIEMRYAALSV